MRRTLAPRRCDCDNSILFIVPSSLKHTSCPVLLLVPSGHSIDMLASMAAAPPGSAGLATQRVLNDNGGIPIQFLSLSRSHVMESAAKYSVNSHMIENLLSWVTSGEIAIPEIQRPFVWDATKVRDLMDSLYKGYPVGYIIAWKNPNVRLKDGSLSQGKKVLIDGQQRITALTAALLGRSVVNSDYRPVNIRIAFHPIEQKFEVLNPAIEKDVHWLTDIAPIVTGELSLIRLVKQYCQTNSEVDEELVERSVENLRQILKKQVGLIELSDDLDIETVTEVFIRINSKGVVLSQADFAMSKIAANERYQGHVIRKCIDYFCHMAIAPEFHLQLKEVDPAFTKTPYFAKMAWLKDENDDLYDPDYSDLLRVAFTTEFERGRLSDLVSLLSGRNFETRTFDDAIAEDSFKRLDASIMNFMSETNFKRFVMIVRSAGLIASSMIRSQNALNFAYIVYLKLRSLKVPPARIERAVRRWLVLSLLTGRYSGSPEARFDTDIRNIAVGRFEKYLDDVEKADLSDAFWNASIIQALSTSANYNQIFNLFLAAQVRGGDKGFLSRDISVADLIVYKGDIHHIFPKEYLKARQVKKAEYNQSANYVYAQSEINIKIGARAPRTYFAEIKKQCEAREAVYGGIDSIDDLRANLRDNCIPDTVLDMADGDYPRFLEDRRILMAAKIRNYYKGL